MYYACWLRACWLTTAVGLPLTPCWAQWWQLSVNFNIQKTESEMESPQYQSFRSFLHIRSLEVCFRSSLSIRACKSINLCNALTGLLDWSWTCFTLGNVVEVPGFTVAVKKSPHFSLKKQCLSAKMATIYLFGFMKSKDHVPIHCPWDLEYWSLTSLNEWQKLYIVPKPAIHANSKLKQLN